MDSYSDTFINLLEEVERQGGELLPETCLPSEYIITVNKPHGGVKKRKVLTTGCGKEMRLEIPYDPSAKVTVPGVATRQSPNPEPVAHDGDHGQGTVIVCAEDDGVHFWPRFEKSVS
jgi:hypothetical protein